MTNDRDAAFDSGYTPDFLAFKHGIPLHDATNLIKRIGLSRRELDKAADSLKRIAGRTRE